MFRRGFLCGASMLVLGSALAGPVNITPSMGNREATPGPGPLNGAPSLDFNFIANPVLDPRITFTRSSSANYFDATGTLQSAATNTPRIDYGPSPGGVTNWIRNSTGAGAVTGTPGTAPTNWLAQIGVSLSWAITGVGVEAGIPYVEWNLFGTPSATAGVYLFPDSTTGTPSTVGQQWTSSAYIRMPGGGTLAASGVSSLNLFMEARDNASTQLVAANGTALNPTFAALDTQRAVQVFALAPANTVSTVMRIRVGVTIGVPVNFTMRVGAPQLELGVVANTWVPTSGAVANVGAVPRGLLIEEARTNSIRNPRAEGAVVGTPGTLPTNWSQSNSTGIVPAVVGFGTENGIPYLDVRWVGTSATGATQNLLFEPANIISAAPSSVWTFSGYFRLVGGSFSNISLIFMQGGDNLAAQTLTIPNPTSASLSSQRTNFTYTVGSGAVTTIRNTSVGMTLAAAPVAIDITLRIGAPQLELGAFATSLILPAIGTPAASTRAADNATSAFVPPANFSAAVEAMIPITPGAIAAGLVVFDDGTNNNRVTLRQAGSVFNAATVTAGVAGASPATPTPTITAGAVFKAGASVAPTLVAGSINGSAPATASGTVPTGLTTMRLGENAAGGGYMNGYLRRMRYWPRALSNVELQSATS